MPDSLRARVAASLDWTERGIAQISLVGLRELVRPYPPLVAELDELIRESRQRASLDELEREASDLESHIGQWHTPIPEWEEELCEIRAMIASR